MPVSAVIRRSGYARKEAQDQPVTMVCVERKGGIAEPVNGEFISELIRPVGGCDTLAMGRGEPGLPEAFQWRGRRIRVLARLAQWKASEPDGGKAGGERYLRRHYFRILMEDASTWTVYFVRQSPKSGSPKSRWFVYSMLPGQAK